MLTVYGIETYYISIVSIRCYCVATVLTVYGIETKNVSGLISTFFKGVATVLTVYGIETTHNL